MKYNIFSTFTLVLGRFFLQIRIFLAWIRIFGRSGLGLGKKSDPDPDPGKKPGFETLDIGAILLENRHGRIYY